MEPFSVAKMFDFSTNTIFKTLSLVFKILVIVGLPVLVVWFAYVTIIKPHTHPIPTSTTQVQAGGTNYSTTNDVKVGFGGCARFPIVKEKK